MARPIRWLHVSDLHFGCRGEGLWHDVEDLFFDDVKAQLKSAAAYCSVLSCSSLYLGEGFSNKLKLHFAITSLAKVFGYGVFVFLVVG